ncbi:gastric triacylglycerol lipase-like [Gigantopelta aegis]|uniref:gastric triacylglycerol lipase-like n=1 Tax=Gigantopelta aegis TaxID=1735272 RepID=UPI001B88E323|nr:gastric triacylglycerol lipase-like [Gigantopelta aegis]
MAIIKFSAILFFLNLNGVQLEGLRTEDDFHEGGQKVDPEVFMNSTQLITSKGYPCENHYVETKDGFILNMQRIPHGRTGTNQKVNQPVVMLQHGLLASSSNFLENPTNESLAFILADAGIDVWLGNVRGNQYSRAHKHLKPSDEKFWEWSYDEMAKYDLPAMVDHILSVTGKRQIYYVGHSQGTMIGFSGFSQNKQLGSKIKLFIALAPVARLGHIESPIKYLAPFANYINLFASLFGKYEFLPHKNFSTFLASEFCDKIGIDMVCENMIFILGGFDTKYMNVSRVPVYVAHSPAGTSVQNMEHFAQGVNHDRFQMYDYGTQDANMAHYGQITPPLYHVDEMETPVVLFSGTHDFLADPTDVSWLAPQLKNMRAHHVIPEWEHMDFVYAVNAPQMCYNKITSLILQ